MKWVEDQGASKEPELLLDTGATSVEVEQYRSLDETLRDVSLRRRLWVAFKRECWSAVFFPTYALVSRHKADKNRPLDCHMLGLWPAQFSCLHFDLLAEMTFSPMRQA